MAGATTPATGESERELTLAEPRAPSPDGGALKDKFGLLLSIYKRPYGDDEVAAWRAFVQACGNDPDIADDILDSARRWIAARPPEKLQKLETWITQGAWKNSPPQKQPRGSGKVSLANIALAISREGQS